MTFLVTGAAGFIGSHVCEALLSEGHTVIGVDNFNTFYDPKIKHQNIATTKTHPNFYLYETDICESETMDAIFKQHTPKTIIHLAARASVTPSIKAPLLYTNTNITGTTVLLEMSAKYSITTFIFGSSSSVYGNNTKVPFSESDTVDHPISPYAATKKAGELLCHTYHHLYGFNVACLRFFTVYGPRQRPEMAIHKFTRLIDNNQPIQLYNHGENLRDYTYIDDIVQGILSVQKTIHGFDVINLGESATISTLDLISLIEKDLGKSANTSLIDAVSGDMAHTFADISKATERYGYTPKTAIQNGITKFITWYSERR